MSRSEFGVDMDMHVEFLGDKRIAAHYRDWNIVTDQPVKSGGAGGAPAPFDLFLASLVTCAAYYVLEFCTARNIPTEGIRLSQQWHRNPETHLIHRIEQEIQLPPDFPTRYEKAVVRAAEMCTVKKHLEKPPDVSIHLTHSRTPTP